MPAAISSATWGDSNRKNHKTPSHGMVFFLTFSGNCGCEGGNVSNLSADKKRNRRKPFLQAGQRLIKQKKRQVSVTFSNYHIFLHKSTKNLYKLNVQKLFILRLEVEKHRRIIMMLLVGGRVCLLKNRKCNFSGINISRF